MVARTPGGTARTEPWSSPLAEHPVAPEHVRRIGRLRVPIAGPYAPWATLYRLPDGREVWCLRLWEVDRVRRATATTDALRRYARRSGLVELERAIDELVRLAREV